jgi:hypothetical protein
MSVFRDIHVDCPNCGARQAFKISHSVNADLRDDLRLSILADEFQRVVCTECTTPFRLEPELTFVDVGRHLWIAALPLPRSARWKSEEEHAAELFQRVYGPRAPQPVQEVGRGLAPRLVFGWILASDETIGDTMRVKRALYDQIAADEDGAWADLRADISAGYFVDLNRLTIAPA